LRRHDPYKLCKISVVWDFLTVSGAWLPGTAGPPQPVPATTRERSLEPPQGVQPSFRRKINHPDLQFLYDYWLERSAEGRAMARDAFDPVDMPGLLKNLILAEVDDAGQAIRYRLVGTEIVAAHGFDFTGWTIERLTSGATLEFTRRLYAKVVTRGAPVYSEGHFQWMDKEYQWTKRLHLPLSRNGDGVVDMVLVGQIFDAVPGPSELLEPAGPAELAADRAAGRPAAP
jgi:hypothetical protein